MSSARSRRTRKTEETAPTSEVTLGLRSLVQKRILDDVFQSSSEKYPGWKVLILDDLAMKVISSTVGMYDIMERKVTIVESLNKKRAPFPDMAAIYVLAPTADSINKLLEDFQSGKVLYGNSIFLYFLERVPDSLLDKIKGCKQLLKRLKALSEINMDFLPKEERAFTFDLHDCYGSFYIKKSAGAEVNKIADQLVTVCGTLNEYPHIRYRSASAVSTSLAKLFHKKMDSFVAQNPNWWYHGGPKKGGSGSAKERGTLLLLDRADDALTPLMHDFYYQAMVHDLLPMEGDRITYKAESSDNPDNTEDKDVLLDEKDSLWVEIRGFHVAQVIHTLSERIREMVNSSASKISGKGDMDLSQMAAAMKALPEYKEVMSKLSQHMHIAHECMDILKKRKLMDLANLEQTLATGTDDEGNSPKLADLIDEAESLIMDMKNVKDRLRLILVITISQGGLRQQDRRRLMNAAELTRKDMRTLNSLEVLGLSLFASPAEKKQGGLASLFGGGKSAAEDEEDYVGTRYKPMLKTTLENLANGALSTDDYPSVMPMPEESSNASSSKRAGSARGATSRSGVGSARKKSDPGSRWNKSSGGSRSSGGDDTMTFSGGRCIVFMLGGLAYSELRVGREVMKSTSREIIMGGTSFLSPKEYMNELEALGLGDGDE